MGVGQKVNSVIMVVVAIVILFSLYAALVPEAMSSGNDLNASNTCVRNGCAWNVTRANDCSSGNTTSTDTTYCDRTESIPLSSLFTSSGFVFILVMIGLLLLVVKLTMGHGKRKE